jgi:hypothetical protein
MKYKFNQDRPLITASGSLFVPGQTYDESEIPKQYLYKFSVIPEEKPGVDTPEIIDSAVMADEPAPTEAAPTKPRKKRDATSGFFSKNKKTERK